MTPRSEGAQRVPMAFEHAWHACFTQLHPCRAGKQRMLCEHSPQPLCLASLTMANALCLPTSVYYDVTAGNLSKQGAVLESSLAANRHTPHYLLPESCCCSMYALISSGLMP